MAEIADALKRLIENSEDLSTLPQLVAQVEELEGKDFEYQDRIKKLQDINRSYLAQIPVPGSEQEEKEEEQQPTLEDAQKQIMEAMGVK